jgi:hypothetical protein
VCYSVPPALLEQGLIRCKGKFPVLQNKVVISLHISKPSEGEFYKYRRSSNLQAATSGAFIAAPSMLPKLTRRKGRMATHQYLATLGERHALLSGMPVEEMCSLLFTNVQMGHDQKVMLKY